MNERSTVTLILAGLGVTGLLAWAANKSPTPEGSPEATIGTGSLIQERPLPDLGALSAASRANYIRTFQSQLGVLGFTSPVNGDWNDPATVAAVNRWLSSADNVNAVRAYNYGGGGGTYVDMRALMMAIDDQARNNTGDTQASDYRAPLSSGRVEAPAAPSASPSAPVMLSLGGRRTAPRTPFVGFIPPGMRDQFPIGGSGKA